MVPIRTGDKFGSDGSVAALVHLRRQQLPSPLHLVFVDSHSLPRREFARQTRFGTPIVDSLALGL